MSEFPKKMTDPKTVKNFRVVVMMEHGNGPKSATQIYMKSCPSAEAKQKLSNCGIKSGCLLMKDKKSINSPV
uniref:Uncharacterized protein n=1 Tax=Lepeophtheirus salmonis TaxID=72036 RepID=A0A0K2UQU0_LEPSM